MTSLNKQLQIGSVFPGISLSALCFTKNDAVLKVERSEIKDEIMNYLKKQGKGKDLFISDLSTNLKIGPKKVINALRELEEEGFLTLD